MMDKVMGVINITPNSFSNTTEINDQESFKSKMDDILAWAQIVDIGAESTAPFNEPITEEQERERFNNTLIPYLLNQPDPETTISIDTYKVSVFKYVATKINEYWPKTKIIFNDVSGKLDDTLIDFFENFTIPYVYIYSHNMCPNRAKTSDHMKYTSDARDLEFIKEMVVYFLNGITVLKKYNVNFWIDPCFGFSKTREQNHILLKHFKTFLLQIPYSISCVYGISKKSFLRFPKDLDVVDPKNIIILEQMHTVLLYDLLKDSMQRELIIRMHDKAPMIAVNNIKKIFDL
ncbi:MAG: dihydropteroate synthase [Halobacteriovoraceae bacterium]|nr:dihydropteroate synthase [Halobacteriovoraceae bacterium]